VSDANAPAPKKADKTEFHFGLFVTVMWLIGAIVVMLCWADRTANPKVNEWGDVFAGLFAPVAFLWLVLGFRQQGRELQLSTRALELQVAELKQSVEQQRELVDVTRQQVLATMDEHDRRRALEQAAIQPLFVLECIGSARAADDSTQWTFSMTNEGETVTEIVVTASPPPIDPPRQILSLRRNEKAEIRLRYGGHFQFPSEVVLDIVFNDMTDTSGNDRRIVTVPEGLLPHYNNLRIQRAPVRLGTGRGGLIAFSTAGKTA